MKFDDHIIVRAILLASKSLGKTLPNPRVGAVVFDDKGKILGKGWHKRFGGPHAEVEAIKDAEKHGYSTKDKNLCVTLEPCNHYGKTPPCSDAIIKAGIKKVYIGTLDDCSTVCGQGILKLKKAGIKVQTGILEKECKALNPGFHKYNTKKLPYVVLKIAISLNGIMGSTWFTSSAARKSVLHTRANSDLVITGTGTIKKDNPYFRSRNNIAILDQKLELYSKYLSKKLNIFKEKGDVIIVTSEARSLKAKINTLRQKGFTVITTKTNKNGLIELKRFIKTLGNDYNFREIMIEAGPTLVRSFVNEAASYIDRVDIYVAPVILTEKNPIPPMPKILVDNQEKLQNTLALKAHFDI